jgi:reactive intermediate/imine deaminase
MMTAAKRQEFQPEGAPQPISHYCEAVRWGDLLFISGAVGVDATGKVVSDDVVEQTRQIFRNMQLALDEAGASAADFLKVTVFLTDVEDRTRINPVRQAFFGSARPASTLIGVKALARPEFKVEIEAIVGLRGR